MARLSQLPHTTFANAPIVEAMIDFGVWPDTAPDLSALRKFGDRIREDYPHSTTKFQWSGEIRLAPDAGPMKMGEVVPVGYAFFSNDRQQVVQARTDGFTFSRLPRYVDWAHLRSTAHRLWDTYVAVSRPTTVTRCAVRFINRILLPAESTDLAQWFRTGPQIPMELPQTVRSFLLRFEIPHPNASCTGLLTMTSERPAQGGHLIVLLDIDVFANVNADPGSEQLWATLDELRDFKNDLFFESTTNRMREMFQ